MNSILVTGGAGYIGSVVVEELISHGYDVAVVDNLQQGHSEALPPNIRFIVGDIRQPDILGYVFGKFKFDAVIHLAAESRVGQSMVDPKGCFHNNVVGGLNLLDVMVRFDVRKLVFSSSAAVYGEPQSIPITESHPKVPVNAYGESKLMFEHIMGWYGKAYGIHHISLRYFNAAGATDHLGEDHRPETHLMPIVLKVALNGDSPVTVFGSDYPTKDGSCIRNYVHVTDIARAHILALRKVMELSGKAYNLGSAEGHSVFDVIDAARKITKAEIPIKVSQRRLGDPAVLIASSERAIVELGWRPVYSELEQIIASAWLWLKNHPNGYSPTKKAELEDMHARQLI